MRTLTALALFALTLACYAALLAMQKVFRRADWLTSVVLPAALGLGGMWAMEPQVRWALKGEAWLVVGLSAAAGVLYDLGSQAGGQGGDVQGRRSAWPLRLWGAAAGCFVAVPYARELAGERFSWVLDAGAGAIMSVAGLAMVGQSASWALRLLTPRPTAGRGGTSFALGTAASLVAVLLAFHNPSAGAAGGSGPKAPAGALLVSSSLGLGAGDIWIVSGSARKLDVKGGGARWSRDGARMAFIREDGQSQLLVAGSDGSNPQRLAASGLMLDPRWSADGSRIYFLQGQGLQLGLSVVPAEGGGVTELLPASEAVTAPAVSPDGRTMAYFRAYDMGQVTPEPQAVKLLDLSSGQARVLFQLPYPAVDMLNVTGMAWTLDGRALILGVERSKGVFALERMDVASGARTRLGDEFSAYPRSFSMAPGGELYLAATTGPGGEIWRVDVSSGARGVVNAGVQAASVDVSPTR